MRKMLLIALLACSCASSGSGPRLAVEVDELYAPDQSVQEVGQHLFHIRVTNRSADVISINSIHLDIAGTNDYEMESPTVTVATLIGPDETQDLEVEALITLSARRSRTMNYRVDSLQVVISGEGPAGNFIDSGTYPIARQRM